MLSNRSIETMTALTVMSHPFTGRSVYLAMAPLTHVAGVLLRERVAHLVVADLEAPADPVKNETAAVFDLTDQSTIAPLLSGCDGVTHLAGIPVDDASTILGDDVRPPADVPQAGDMASAEFTLRFL